MGKSWMTRYSDTVFTETMGNDGGVLLVLTHLDFLLVKIDVEAIIGLLKIHNLEVVDKHIGKDGT